MHIRIWSQFSANHSAGFTVVGQFETSEQAAVVAEEIRAILRKIAQWHELRTTLQEKGIPDEWIFKNQYLDLLHTSDPELHTKLLNPAHPLINQPWSVAPNPEKADLTPIEQILKEIYGLTNWHWKIEYAQDSTRVGDVVNVLGNTLFLSEAYIDQYTWTGPAPFDELLERLGGQVAVEEEAGPRRIVATLTFMAPNDTVVKQILAAQHFWRDDPLVRFKLPSTLIKPGARTILHMGGAITHDGLSVTIDNFDLFASWDTDFHILLEYLQLLGCSAFEYSFRNQNSW
jgi:hypothetical protein